MRDPRTVQPGAECLRIRTRGLNSACCRRLEYSGRNVYIFWHFSSNRLCNMAMWHCELTHLLVLLLLSFSVKGCSFREDCTTLEMAKYVQLEKLYSIEGRPVKFDPHSLTSCVMRANRIYWKVWWNWNSIQTEPDLSPQWQWGQYAHEGSPWAHRFQPSLWGKLNSNAA